LKELVKKYSDEKIKAEARKAELQSTLNEVKDKLTQVQKSAKRIDAIDIERIRSLSTEWE